MKKLIFPLLMALALLAGCKGTEEKPAQPTPSQSQNQPATPTSPETPK